MNVDISFKKYEKKKIQGIGYYHTFRMIFHRKDLLVHILNLSFN